MNEQPNSSAAEQSTAQDGKADSVGQAILGLLTSHGLEQVHLEQVHLSTVDPRL